MLKAGILEEGAAVELLDGLLIWKNRAARGEDSMTIGGLHMLITGKIMDELAPALKVWNCHLRLQGPVTVPPDKEPEPDAAIARGKRTDYVSENPKAGDVFCVMEVADSSLERDRTDKQRIYADAGIPQYIIINLVDKQLEVHEQPLAGQGRYGQIKVLKHGDKAALLVGAEQRLEISASGLLP
jgi:Uma2 family endonuclease